MTELVSSPSKPEYQNKLDTSLLSLLKDSITDDYVVDIQDYKEVLNIVAEYRDAYESERITVFRDIDNEISVTVTRHNYDEDEIRFPEACHECVYEECEYYDSKTEECTLEEISRKELEEFKAKAVNKTIQIGNAELQIMEEIVTETCYVNVTHEHVYKAVTLILKTYSLSNVESFLSARDMIFDLATEIISMCRDKNDKQTDQVK